MKYKVIKPTSRKFYVVRYEHPLTGEPKQQSTKHTRKRDAERFAAEFVSKVESGIVAARDLKWESFVDRCKEEYLIGIPSRASYKSALASFHKGTGITSTRQITNATLSKYLAWTTQSKLAQTSIDSYLKHLRAIFGWASSVGIIARAPIIQAGGTNVMRGRPLSLEEFERMLTKSAKAVGAKNAREFKDAMLGCWTIGLRRSEILKVSWDDPELIQIREIQSRRPTIHFPADQHKARREVTLPLLPEAIEMLRRRARRGKTGLVFGPFRGLRKVIETADGIGRAIADIGAKAKVVTDIKDGEPVYATAHDLRRSLGTRLVEANVPLPIIQQLMRHASITTTIEHYVRFTPERMAAQLEGYTLGDTTKKPDASQDIVSLVVKEL